MSGSHIPNAAAAHAEVGDIRRRLGDLEGAQAAFDVAEKLSGRTCVGGALLRLAQGRIDEAERIIHDCLPGQPPRRPARIPVLGVAVQVGIARGDLEGASAAHAELEEIAATYDSTLFHAQAALAAGRIRLAEHDIEGACTSLRNALQHWQDLEVPYEIATTRTLLGLALRESGDEDGAIASFADADAMFTRIGAKYTGRVEHRRDGTRPGGLTEREVEVLRMICVGPVEQTDRGRHAPQPEDRVTSLVEHLHENRRVISLRRNGVRVRSAARHALRSTSSDS